MPMQTLPFPSLVVLHRLVPPGLPSPLPPLLLRRRIPMARQRHFLLEDTHRHRRTDAQDEAAAQGRDACDAQW
jgi:hypothetical protein